MTVGLLSPFPPQPRPCKNPHFPPFPHFPRPFSISRVWCRFPPVSTNFEPIKVRLRNGTPAITRLIGPADGVALTRGLTRLSPTGHAYRFLQYRTGFTDAELHYLTHCDQIDHFALILAILDDQGREIDQVGVARCIRTKEDPIARRSRHRHRRRMAAPVRRLRPPPPSGHVGLECRHPPLDGPLPRRQPRRRQNPRPLRPGNLPPPTRLQHRGDRLRAEFTGYALTDWIIFRFSEAQFSAVTFGPWEISSQRRSKIAQVQAHIRSSRGKYAGLFGDMASAEIRAEDRTFERKSEARDRFGASEVP